MIGYGGLVVLSAIGSKALRVLLFLSLCRVSLVLKSPVLNSAFKGRDLWVLSTEKNHLYGVLNVIGG